MNRLLPLACTLLLACVVNPVPTPGTAGAAEASKTTDTGVLDAGSPARFADAVSGGSGGDVAMAPADIGRAADGGGALDADSGGGPDGGPVTPPCGVTATSDLPGVTLEVDTTKCSFSLAEAAAGIAIPWIMHIEASPDPVIALPRDAGHCGKPNADGLIVFARLSGGGQNYCICDTGLCMPPSDKPVMLQDGDHQGKFTWDGRAWSGPSDTGNPKGAPFPAGTYELSLSAGGKRVLAGGGKVAFEVRVRRTITLTP